MPRPLHGGGIKNNNNDACKTVLFVGLFGFIGFIGLFGLFGFMAHNHNISHMEMNLANLRCYKLQSNTRSQTHLTY
jgi:hypothetical protein